MWADGGPIDPSPTIDQAINGGYAWLEIACSRCKTPRNVDLCALPHVPSTCVHDLAGRLRCMNAGKGEATAGHAVSARPTQATPRQRSMTSVTRRRDPHSEPKAD
jgi:hypothetical protein